MTNLVRRDPFSEFRSTMMNHLLEGGLSRPWRSLASEEELEFPIEISETAVAIEVKASLPGVKPADVDISVQNGVLTIKADHKEEFDEQKKDYYRRELRYGFFHRSFALSAVVDVEKATATFENGILRLTLPKPEVAKPKQIKVN